MVAFLCDATHAKTFQVVCISSLLKLPEQNVICILVNFMITSL